jgi:tetratricopeptide (TPR) repeat protein
MRYLVLLALTVLFPLFAVELKELQRTEDWELLLGKASQLTREQKFDNANEIYLSLTEAADHFSFPLILKAKCRNNHGAMLHLSGRYSEAERKYKEAARYWISATGEESDEHATTLNKLGEVYRQLGRFPEAETAYRSSLAIREAIFRKDQLRLAAALNNLATSQVQSLQATGAGSLGVARTLSSMGEVQRAQSRHKEAEGSFERALQIKRDILGPNHPDIATSLNNLGALRQDAGDMAGAEKMYLEAVAIREAQSPVDRPALASLLNNISTLHRRTGRLQSAEGYVARAVKLWEESVGAQHPTLAAGLNNMAELMLALDRPSEAEPLFRRSIAIQEATLGANHPQTATAYDNLGVLFLKQGKGPGAESLFRRALAARTAQLGPNAGLTLESMHHLGQCLNSQGRYTEAERVLVDELTIVEANKMQRTPQHGFALAELAYLQLAQRRFPEGERYLNEVSAFAAELPAGQREQVGALYQAYATILRGAKRNRDAERIEGKARGFLAQ